MESQRIVDRYPLEDSDLEEVDPYISSFQNEPMFVELPENANLIQQYNAYRYNIMYWDSNLRRLEAEADNMDDFKVNEIVDGRISFAYEDLRVLPRKIVRQICQDVTYLDISHNRFKNFRFLHSFRRLHTLVMDRNMDFELQSFPVLPNLRVLYMNYCNVKNLTQCVYQLTTSCPNIEHLSLMGNPIANTFKERCTPISQHDYRMFIIHLLRKLKYLDDKAVTAEEREHAAENHSTLYFRQCPADEDEITPKWQNSATDIEVEPFEEEKFVEVHHELESIKEEEAQSNQETTDSEASSNSNYLYPNSATTSNEVKKNSAVSISKASSLILTPRNFDKHNSIISTNSL